MTIYIDLKNRISTTKKWRVGFNKFDRKMDFTHDKKVSTVIWIQSHQKINWTNFWIIELFNHVSKFLSHKSINRFLNTIISEINWADLWTIEFNRKMAKHPSFSFIRSNSAPKSSYNLMHEIFYSLKLNLLFS